MTNTSIQICADVQHGHTKLQADTALAAETLPTPSVSAASRHNSAPDHLPDLLRGNPASHCTSSATMPLSAHQSLIRHKTQPVAPATGPYNLPVKATTPLTSPESFSGKVDSSSDRSGSSSPSNSDASSYQPSDTLSGEDSQDKAEALLARQSAVKPPLPPQPTKQGVGANKVTSKHVKHTEVVTVAAKMTTYKAKETALPLPAAKLQATPKVFQEHLRLADSLHSPILPCGEAFSPDWHNIGLLPGGFTKQI